MVTINLLLFLDIPYCFFKDLFLTEDFRKCYKLDYLRAGFLFLNNYFSPVVVVKKMGDRIKQTLLQIISRRVQSKYVTKQINSKLSSEQIPEDVYFILGNDWSSVRPPAHAPVCYTYKRLSTIDNFRLQKLYILCLFFFCQRRMDLLREVTTFGLRSHYPIRPDIKHELKIVCCEMTLEAMTEKFLNNWDANIFILTRATNVKTRFKIAVHWKINVGKTIRESHTQ